MVLRRLRGAFGTALTWAIGWFAAGLVVVTASNLFNLGFREYLDFSVARALEYAGTVAAVGFLTGLVFSLYVAAAFRGRSLENLRPAVLTLGGAGVAAAFYLGWLTVFGGLAALDSAGLLLSIAMPAALGGLTAYGSIRVAQRALPASAATGGTLPRQ